MRTPLFLGDIRHQAGRITGSLDEVDDVHRGGQECDGGGRSDERALLLE